ncbi:MAG TPA: glycine zipper 2TM domain-containing protein [Steroidobacteraceae bacterium]
MTRQTFVTAAAGFLGLSVFMLSACGRTPTGPAYAPQAIQDPDAPDVATLDADQPMPRAAITDETTTTQDATDDLSRREAELAAREQELRAQQDQLRRERERLEAESRGRSSTVAETDPAYDADEATTPTPNAATSSIQKVPSLPIVVPPGTPLEIELTANVNTKVARVGDRVEGRLATDLLVDDRRAAVAGATVTGSVTELVSGSDKVGGTPTLGLTFDSLQAANGAIVPIMARYRQQSGSDTGADAAKVVGGAAAGAVIGHQVDDDGDDDNEGTVVGGILGGAAGAAVAQKTGGEVKIHAGTVIKAPTETSFSIY